MKAYSFESERNALEEFWMTLNDGTTHMGMISYSRIIHDTIPNGYNCYEIRHDDGSKGDPVTVEAQVFVNFYGTFITKDVINIPAVIVSFGWQSNY